MNDTQTTARSDFFAGLAARLAEYPTVPASTLKAGDRIKLAIGYEDVLSVTQDGDRVYVHGVDEHGWGCGTSYAADYLVHVVKEA